MNEVTVKSDPRLGSQITVEQYRSWIQTRITRRRLDLSSATRMISLHLAKGSVRRLLTDFISTQFSDISVDGHVLFGVHEVLGGIVGPASIDEITDRLLELALVYGPDSAASIFLRAIEDPSCEYQAYTLLDGISVEEPIEIFDGVRLSPLPRSTGDLPPHLPEFWGHSGVSDIELLGGVLLEVDRFLTPRFAPPAKDYDTLTMNRKHFSAGVRSSDLDAFSVQWFCRALSLASRTTVRDTISWNHVPFQEIGQRIHSSQGWSSIHRYGRLSRVRLEERVGEVVSGTRSRYQTIAEASPELMERLNIPIERWMESGASKGMLDRAIDLGIALESFYVNDGGESIQYKLGVRAARHLRDSLDERKKVKWQMTRAYGFRSEAAHGGTISGKKLTYDDKQHTVEELFEEARDLCAEGIDKAISEGVPDWDEVMFS